MPTYECPTCRKVVQVAGKEDAPFRPFCCERCKLVDLGRWFDGTYTISEPTTNAALPPNPQESEKTDHETT